MEGRAGSAGHRPGRTRTWLVSCWALGGLSLTFIQAIWRLGARGLATIASGLNTFQWTALVLLTIAFVYGEGMRGIQQRFVPKAVERLHELLDRSLVWQLSGPAYLVSLVGAPARSMARAWLGACAIVIAVLTVRALPEPWRGIVDLAVVAALVWGLVALLVAALVSLQRRPGASPT